jgi:hypothetical protein
MTPLRIDVGREKKLAVPLHHLGSVVCFGNIIVSPALMHPDWLKMGSLAGCCSMAMAASKKARLEGPFITSSAAQSHRRTGPNFSTGAGFIYAEQAAK